MSRKKKLGTNVIYMTAGNMASKILSFLLIPLYTAVLSTSEYGISDIMTTTITLLSPIFTLQISEAVMRFCLDEDSDKKKILNIGVSVFLWGFFSLVLISPISFLFFKEKVLVILFLLYYATCTSYTLFSQYAKGIDRVKQYSIGGVINTFIVIICNIVFLIYLRIGIYGYIASFIIGNGLVSIYLVIATKAYRDIDFKYVDLKYLKSMIRYSAPMIPNSISWWITNSSDKYMVAFLVGTAANGVYSIAYKIPSLLSMVNTVFMSAWHISAVDEFGSESSKRFFSGIYKMLSSLNALLVACLVFGAKPIANFLYSKDFYGAWKFSIILILGFMFSSLSSFLGSIYTSSKQTGALFYTSLIGAGVNILLNFYLIPVCGVAGAAIATTFSYILVWIIRLINTKRVFDFEKCIINNVMCGVILSIQIITTYFEMTYSTIISGICLFIVVILNFGFIKKCVSSAMELINCIVNRSIRK